MIESSQPLLLELSTTDLMSKFGQGNATPGAGSAAALMGILSCKLLETACTISMKKVDPKSSEFTKIKFIKSQLKTKFEAPLAKLFQLDSDQFELVVRLRVERDSATSHVVRRNRSKKELKELARATETILKIGDICIELLDYGVSVFELGYVAVRGDIGTSISAASAGSLSALFISNLNLKKFRTGKWAVETRRARDEQFQKHQLKSRIAIAKLLQLKDEADGKGDPQPMLVV